MNSIPDVIHHLSLFADINECAKPEANDCDTNATCNNTEGSYVCRCISGYQGDGKNCKGINTFILVAL